MALSLQLPHFAEQPLVLTAFGLFLLPFMFTLFVNIVLVMVRGK